MNSALTMSSRLLALCVACVPAVALAQAGAPNPKPGPSTPVTVTNTPVPVTVGGGVNVSGSVTIGNTAANPVPTRPVGQPVQATVGLSCGGVSTCVDVIYTVPAGKRLIIEFVSFRTDTPELTEGFAASVGTTAGGVSVQHELGMLDKHPRPGPNAQHQKGFPVTLYADQVTDVTVRVSLGDFFTIPFVRASMSGRLVDY